MITAGEKIHLENDRFVTGSFDCCESVLSSLISCFRAERGERCFAERYYCLNVGNKC